MEDTPNIAPNEKYLLIVLGGPQSGKDRFIQNLEESGRLGPHALIGPKLADRLEGIEEARKKTNVHPEKLPEMLPAYDALIRESAMEAIDKRQSVVINGHGDDISRIEDVINHARSKANKTPYHVVIVGLMMAPDHLFTHIHERVEKHNIPEEDQERILKLHKAFRTNLRAFTYMADVTLVYNRNHKEAPQPAAIYEPGERDLHRTVLDRDGYHNFLRWNQVDPHAQTLAELYSQREPELKSSASNMMHTPHAVTPEQRKHREFAERLLGVSLEQGRSR